MKKEIIFCLLMLGCVVQGNSQFTDNFADGNFTNNPEWTGNAADWVVNTSFQLQSNNTVSNSSYFICTSSMLATNAEWDFYCQLNFNPSGANYVDVYLTASSWDLSLNSTTGYFVRIGNTDDEISLYRKDAGASIKLIDGANGLLNSSNNLMRVKVVRDASNQWSLYRDMSGTGNSYINEGAVTDNTYLTGNFFGILIKQSTAGFFQRHFFDDIEVKNYVPDLSPPVIQTVVATSANALQINFNEAVDSISSQVISNYTVNNGLGFPLTVLRDVANPALVHLTFVNNFPNRTNMTLNVNGVKDLAGNAISNGAATFSYYSVQPYDIIIDELMADPSPPAGLPEVEWIELRNTSAFNIDLNGFRIVKSSGQSGPVPSYILKPDSLVVLCSTSAAPAMSLYGPVIGTTGFPALNNVGDVLSIRSKENRTVHSVNYADTWYNNEMKKMGGWSLEMIDSRNPCTGFSNWTASVDVKGGTPGKKNSADRINPDNTDPRLLRSYALDSVTIILVFNEPVDSISASRVAGYSVSDGIGSPLSAAALSPSFDRVQIHLGSTNFLARNKIYKITVTGITDCAGNAVSTSQMVSLGIAGHTDSLDIVLNEILFNPKPSCNDYVEIYNRSNKILNLKDLFIANRNTSGAISSIKQLTTEDYLLFPQDFMVVTENRLLVLNDYMALNPSSFLEIQGFPSFNDDQSSVILINEQGRIIDEVAYSDKWHFKLLANKEGVSLERIDPDAATQDEQNWTSAATNVGYGTPTYKNSQFRQADVLKGEITVTPEIVSPDNDGIDDFATIGYNFPEPGYVSSITIFDAAGRTVRLLQRNTLNGLKGFYRWDGLGEKHQKLPAGIYIIYTEVFNLQGKTGKYKKVVVLANKG